jgi:glycosyltransferase involved in cell wall biosynthesis
VPTPSPSPSGVRILGVIDEAPFDYRTWSGSSRYFFEALRRAGSLYEAVVAEPSLLETRLFQARDFLPDRASWRFKFHLDTGFYRRRTAVVRRRMRALDDAAYDVVLQIGAWYDLTGTPGKATASYHDGNLATLLASPYGHPPLARRHVARTLAWERELYRRMDVMFPMSRWLADSFMADFGVPADKLFPVGAGVNLPRILEVGERSYDRPEVLFVGKDFARKGGPVLLEAFRAVRREIPEARLTLIGPRLEDVPDGVRCLGVVPKNTPEGLDRLLAAYAEASLFVLPSLYEPFGIAFAEAMAHKVPCIGADNCAMPEIVADGETGYLVPVSDARALARRMLDLLKDPEACRRMGEAGYRKYRERYTWDQVVARILGVLRDRL